ncbi:MAG: hypothetical protein J07HX5_00952 [halophilic archaeon J07HX5]|jgi:FOG: WD40-like repeat|nr:MAG: hypothetical protein J07HX5_00952 [halophilic archaeon J07HX5]
MSKRTRREWLCLIGAGGVAGLAGCSSSGTEADGIEQWRFETGDGVPLSVFSSPTVVGGTVYIKSRDYNVHALSAADGTEQWTFEGSGVCLSPTVVDGTVYVGIHDGNVYALSAAAGTEQWRFETEDYVASSPAVVDNTVYVGIHNKMYALSNVDGESTE